MNTGEKRIFEFEQFRLDEGKRLLFSGSGDVVPLMPKAFEILIYRARNAGSVVE